MVRLTDLHHQHPIQSPVEKDAQVLLIRDSLRAIAQAFIQHVQLGLLCEMSNAFNKRLESESTLTKTEMLTFVQDLYSLLTWPTFERRGSPGTVLTDRRPGT